MRLRLVFIVPLQLRLLVWPPRLISILQRFAQPRVSQSLLLNVCVQPLQLQLRVSRLLLIAPALFFQLPLIDGFVLLLQLQPRVGRFLLSAIILVRRQSFQLLLFDGCVQPRQPLLPVWLLPLSAVAPPRLRSFRLLV